MDSLKGKVAVVTGGSAGIGAAVARLLARHGCGGLVLTGRSEERLRTVAADCRSLGLRDDQIAILTVPKIEEEDGVRLLAKFALERFSTIHILVNNAGHGNGSDSFENSSVEVLDTMYKMHVRSPCLLTQLLLEQLKANKGSVINIASLAGVQPAGDCIPRTGNTKPKVRGLLVLEIVLEIVFPGLEIPNQFTASLKWGHYDVQIILLAPRNIPVFEYSVAKAAMIHMTKCMASSMAKSGVRFNSISPGLVKTNIFRISPDQEEEAFARYSPMLASGRMGEAEEVAQLVAFLASDAACYITGQDVGIDGADSITTYCSIALQAARGKGKD